MRIELLRSFDGATDELVTAFEMPLPPPSEGTSINGKSSATRSSTVASVINLIVGPAN